VIQGYAGKFLEVDLTKGKWKNVVFDETVLRDYVGGRGLATKILWDRLGQHWESVDPLSPDNLLLFLTGPLTGYYPGARTCVSGKSPQCCGVVGSTVGGEFGVELRCAGYDGIITKGKSSKPVFLFVKDEDVEIRDAKPVWGKDAKRTMTLLTKECRDLLRKRYGRFGEWREPAMLYIGPAGEKTVRTAVVCAKWAHAAGYGGYGAVMGSKNLKAVVVKGSSALPDVTDLKRVMKLTKEVCNEVYDEGELWRRWGTGGGGFSFAFKTSSEPVRNWQGEWHNARSYGVDQFENRVWVKQFWCDFGCPTSCLKVAMVKSGKFKGAITDNPDYELQAYLGPNLGIFTPEENVYLASVIDDLGLCGIQTGNMMGFVAELYQRGIVISDDLDGLELKWGDTEAFGELARKIAFREGVGDLLAEGTYRAAQKLGKEKGLDLMRYAVTSKGIAIGAHGIRSGKDFAESIGYACGVQGGDHTSLTGLPLADGEPAEIFNDSAVLCNFNSFGIRRNLKFEFYEAVTGLPMTRKEWTFERGLRILELQRAMLLLGGPDVRWCGDRDDVNPERFYEPLPDGPYKGRKADRKEVEDYKKRYYRAVGWDRKGIPTSDILRKLGLADVDAALEKLR
jgi:aldehyde:ferredoxin oxidoreductase